MDEITETHRHSCLNDHERKTWSVFFNLFKKHGKGCAGFWFRYQLAKMDRFLQSNTVPGNAGASQRLRNWMKALGLNVEAVEKSLPVGTKLAIPRWGDGSRPVVAFQSSLDDLVAEAHRKSLPLLRIEEDGKVVANEEFLGRFKVPAAELQGILDAADGGFLPWGGDLLAKLFSREADLNTYLQMVSLGLDGLGRPEGLPSIRLIPTSHVVHVTAMDCSMEHRCLLKAIQVEHVDTDFLKYQTTISFEISAEHAKPKARPASMVQFANLHLQKRVETLKPNNAHAAAASSTTTTSPAASLSTDDDDDVDDWPVKADIFPDDDEAWLDTLLNWATKGDSAIVLSGKNDDDFLHGEHGLPLADDVEGF